MPVALDTMHSQAPFHTDTEVPASPNAAHTNEHLHPAGYFDLAPTRDASHPATPSTSGRRSSMSIQLPPMQTTMDLAFTALQYIPMPLLVLSSDKHVLLANEAMGRLFNLNTSIIDHSDTISESHDLTRTHSGPRSATDILYGLSIGSLGIDILQDGTPLWVTWDDFLDSILKDAWNERRASEHREMRDDAANGELTPKLSGTNAARDDAAPTPSNLPDTDRATIHEVIVDVVFTVARDPDTGLPLPPSENAKSPTASTHQSHAEATLIISIWFLDGQQHFTLTFTAAHNVPLSQQKASQRTVAKTHRNYMSGLGSGSSSSSGGRRIHYSSHASSPHSQPQNWIPNGPASTVNSGAASSTLLSKATKMKDALLNAIPLPVYAMWKDESFGIPNKAALELLGNGDEASPNHSSDQRDFLGQYQVYKGNDFKEELPLDQLPIFQLMKTQKGFKNMRVGMVNHTTGDRRIYDTDGEEILDEKTGEFVGGLVVFRDVTFYADTITRHEALHERQFEDIANMIPVMVWTTRPDGWHDYFSNRWYDYTGLSEDECMGHMWKSPFHPDDVPLAAKRWNHALHTGEEYVTEYRCQSQTGEWRWMLGRALPMRDSAGQIIKWFGTCTDIHDLVEAREEAKQTREQLLKVIEHAKITLWAVDKAKRLVLHEGQRLARYHNNEAMPAISMGKDIFEVFSEQQYGTEMEMKNQFEAPIDDILSGRTSDESVELAVDNPQRWYRTRFVPLHKQDRSGGVEGAVIVDGVVGVSMDVTELKRREEELRERDRENGRLLAQSEAAKEASKMKSQFLANMSHEIRTPIAGVIGMAELLLDDTEKTLTQDQRECAENLQRSANALLTVINDILDFSKVESGRLDIEEVQFDLNVVVRDVNKMLSYAAERKGLNFIDETQELQRLKVVGDPGRVRQILTNLLTNSIKFTSEGHVKMGVQIVNEDAEKITVKFSVEDTGIGIEEEVRKRLFQPFSQADSSTARRFGGTGLGLTISKNLVELMHGDISLDSTLGQGTRATFSIPFTKAPFYSDDASPLDMGLMPDRLQSDLSISDYTAGSIPGTPGKTPSRRPSSHAPLNLTDEERQKVHVLVVEDNPINQQIALKTIKKLKFSVNAVWNGQEALDYLLKPPTAERPRPDIILMDVQMPVMDGYRATYTIRHAAPFASDSRIQDTPIVAMTASAIQGDREKCESAGMNDYLAKPVQGKVLEKMLVKWALDLKRKRKDKSSSPAPDLRVANRKAIPRRLANTTDANATTASQSDGDASSVKSPNRLSVDSTGTLNDRSTGLPPDLSTKDLPNQSDQGGGSRDSTSDSATETTSTGPPTPITAAARRLQQIVATPDALTSKLRYTTYASRHDAAAAVVRRSSETPATSALQHYENEERAMLLRDEQLIASAEDPQHPGESHPPMLPTSSSSSINAAGAVAASGAAGAGPLTPEGGKLTVENMARLEGRAGRLSREARLQHGAATDDGNSSLDVIVGDTPLSRESSSG